MSECRSISSGAVPPSGRPRSAKRRSAAFAALLAALAAAACTPAPNSLDALRQQRPDATARAAAEHHVVASCLLDREVRRGYRPVTNDRDNEGRITITAHSSARPSAVTSRLLFEYNVGEAGPGVADVELRRTAIVNWSTPSADVRLREDLAACGIAAQVQEPRG